MLEKITMVRKEIKEALKAISIYSCLYFGKAFIKVLLISKIVWEESYMKKIGHFFLSISFMQYNDNTFFNGSSL